jgi:hypothetical protein
MSRPQDIEKFQERSAEHHASTYGISAVGVEGRVMDDKSFILNVDGSSDLEVVWGPGTWKKVQEISVYRYRHPLTYVAVLLSKVQV